ncbi:MAG: hypothetical protein QXH62_05485, partial [Candidatus Bathyarchaeia archaeon]
TCLNIKNVIKNPAIPIRCSRNWVKPEPANNTIIVSTIAENKRSSEMMHREKRHLIPSTNRRVDNVRGIATPGI